jgi:tetratricopeptide (TPR) repeat protein/transcriptional regulator with XRE-family HTH domain
MEKSWSQQELANQIGTTSVNISRWENNATSPSPYFRQRLCDVFGKTPAELGLLPSPPRGTRISNIPNMHNPFFTGREQLLATLHKRLSTARKAALTQPQALFGLGGIGKTQTAAEYVFRFGDDYSYLFWLRAASRETLIADFVVLAELLDLPEKDEQDQQRVIDAVRGWLASQEGCLLILDNADDLDLAQEFLPTNHKGYILYTTRSQAAGEIATSIEVEKLSLEDGTLLLLRQSKLLDMDTPLAYTSATIRDVAERIVGKLDGLPLAIVQAAAYIEETGCGLEDYLQLYITHRKELLARHSRFLRNYPETVATTWALSFQQVEQQSSVAADILRLCAFLAPDAIPEEVFTRGANELGTLLEDTVMDQFKLNEAFKVLRGYSLVRRNGSIHMLSIHRLVQTVLKESMDRQTQRIWAERTVRVVNAAFPEIDYGTGAKQQSYMPHVQECSTLIAHYHLLFPESGQLLHQAGVFLYSHSLYRQSQSLFQQALAIRERVFGFEHPVVAESLNRLGLLARLQSDCEQAEKFHKQALAIREKTLGVEHPTTAESLNNLGVLYRNQGKHKQAEVLLQQALSIREQFLGSEHPDTMITFINLAKLYADQGKYEIAEQLLQEALETCERIFQPADPRIAHTLSLLAKVYADQGKYERAEMLLKRAIDITEQTRGPEHPAIAERLNELAELYTAQGRYTQAQSLCKQALTIAEKRLGPEHPDTIAIRKHLNKIVSKRKEEQNNDHHPAPPH